MIEEWLTAEERQLCAQLRCWPRYYLKFKEQVVQECKQRGFFEPAMGDQLLQIDAARTGKVVEFLVSCGYVTAAAH